MTMFRSRLFLLALAGIAVLVAANPLLAQINEEGVKLEQGMPAITM